MSVRRSVITAAIVLAVLLIGIWRAGPSSEDPAYVESAPEREPLQIEIVTRETEPRQESPRFLVESDTDPLEGLVGEGLNRMGGSVEQDLSIVDDVLMAWQTNFAGTGNPVGLNSEITAALTGRNRLRLDLIPSDHPAINDAGALEKSATLGLWSRDGTNLKVYGFDDDNSSRILHISTVDLRAKSFRARVWELN